MASLLDKFADAAVDAFINTTGGIEKHRGRYGEWQTRNELRFTNLLGKKGRILKNLYVPKVHQSNRTEDRSSAAFYGDETTEIDTLFVTQKGIFVLEVKNYSGWIFGKEKDRYWTQTFANGKKNKFFNPILQNQGHIKHLSAYLNGQSIDQLRFFSIISFLDNSSELKKITVTSPDVWVITSDRIYATIRDVWNNNPDVLDASQVDDICEKLKPLTKADKAIKEKHVKNIKEKREENQPSKKDEIHPAKSIQASSDSVVINGNDKDIICPKCGGRLVLRTAKTGKYAGNKFYGCSNYPKCRYLHNINE